MPPRKGIAFHSVTIRSLLRLHRPCSILNNANAMGSNAARPCRWRVRACHRKASGGMHLVEHGFSNQPWILMQTTFIRACRWRCSLGRQCCRLQGGAPRGVQHPAGAGMGRLPLRNRWGAQPAALKFHAIVAIEKQTTRGSRYRHSAPFRHNPRLNPAPMKALNCVFAGLTLLQVVAGAHSRPRLGIPLSGHLLLPLPFGKRPQLPIACRAGTIVHALPRAVPASGPIGTCRRPRLRRSARRWQPLPTTSPSLICLPALTNRLSLMQPLHTPSSSRNS